MAKQKIADRVRRLAVLRMSHRQIADKLDTYPSYVKRILKRRATRGRPFAQSTIDDARAIVAKYGP